MTRILPGILSEYFETQAGYHFKQKKPISHAPYKDLFKLKGKLENYFH